MSTKGDSYAPGDSIGQLQGPQKPSKSQSESSPKPPSAHIGSAKTEVPHEPDQIHHAFERPVLDPLAIGNPAYELSLKLDGKLGHFMDRNSTCPVAITIPIYSDHYRTGALHTLTEVLRRLLKLKGYIEYVDIETRVADTAHILADGIVIMTYLKLRAVNSLNPGTSSRFLKKPQTPTPFEVPSPYALAISHMGLFKVSSLEEEKIFIPTYPSDFTKFGLPAARIWSSTKYAQAVEYAKSLGMQFSTVDLNVKVGSSWWMYEQEVEDDIFTLKCPLPEDNYTEATAALHTLFCANDAGGLQNVFFDLTNLGTADYGNMMRNPPQDINVSTYFAIDAGPISIWNVV